jgi:hypothetical protein
MEIYLRAGGKPLENFENIPAIILNEAKTLQIERNGEIEIPIPLGTIKLMKRKGEPLVILNIQHSRYCRSENREV